MPDRGVGGRLPLLYHNRVLRVNLGDGAGRASVTTEPLRPGWARDFVGGKGLGLRYLFAELRPGTDPLGPGNKLILAPGPVTGTLVPTSGRLTLVTRSPATGTLLDSGLGGTLGAALRWAGYDLVIIEGRSGVPVYLEIEDDRVELKSAGHLWGLGAQETERRLINDLGAEYKVASIGPAGENMVTFACITSEFYRQAARGGIGAVMGSKRLKAIAVRGTRGVPVPSARFTERMRELMVGDVLTDTNLWTYTDGTAMLVDMSDEVGILPTRNFQAGTDPNKDNLNHEAVKAVTIRKKACVSCPLGCGKLVRIGNVVIEGPEYETLAMAGSNCGISDLEAVVRFNLLCDDLGLDSISMGSVTAMAMELTERGIADFGVTFGDVEGYLRLPSLVATRIGAGRELALGARQLARNYGAPEMAVEVKGLELPAYDPRGSWGMGLSYATADRGGCHMRAWLVADEAFGDMDPFTTEGKGAAVADLQDYNALKFSLVLCDFWVLDWKTMAEVMSTSLDREYRVEDAKRLGERIWNLGRLFNNREGFDATDDVLPPRLLNRVLRQAGRFRLKGSRPC